MRALSYVGLLVLASLLLSPFAAAADALQAPEYRIKAAFLVRFCRYVEWPESAFSSAAPAIVVGVLDADQLADELDVLLAAERDSGPALRLRRLHPGDPLTDLHVLFVGRDARDRLSAIQREAADHPLLIVTESDGALDQGSAINFLVEDGKVRFDIALQPAAAHALKISSRLLAVARRVYQPASQGRESVEQPDLRYAGVMPPAEGGS